MSQAAKEKIRGWVAEAGFDACGFASAAEVAGNGAALADFLAAGHHGGMAWMADRVSQRAAVSTLWPDAQSLIVCGLNYGPSATPLTARRVPGAGEISVYARHRDYHDVVKPKLKQVARRIHAEMGAAVKVFVDTAPVMEKPLAHQAGVGWQGKHTNLVSRSHGAWLFLGVIATVLDLAPDPPHHDHCGRCRRCLDACPTGALVAAHRMDARRCVSYLTIEHKGPIPHDLRPLIGTRIYGCDDCLAVCPWNRFAQVAQDAKLQARDDLLAPDLVGLSGLDEPAFRTLFSGSPIKRIGRGQFLRNVAIAMGNSPPTPRISEALLRLLADDDPVVRAAAVWGVSRHLPTPEFHRLAVARLGVEREDMVCLEWRQAVSLGEGATPMTDKTLPPLSKADIPDAILSPAVLAHELRTPLAAVQGLAALMADQVYGELGDARYVAAAEHVVQACRHMEGLIAGTLDAAKLHQGNSRLEETDLDLSDVIAVARSWLHQEIVAAGVVVRARVELKPVWVRADARRLRQAVLNVLDNAIKYTPSGGRIDVEIGVAEQGGPVILIRNEAPVAPQKKAKAKPDMVPVSRYDGNGLGLYITNCQMQAHGGEMRRRQTVDGGMEVELILPPSRWTHS